MPETSLSIGFWVTMVPVLVWPVWTSVTRTGSPAATGGEIRVGRVVMMVAVGRNATAAVMATALVPAGSRPCGLGAAVIVAGRLVEMAGRAVVDIDWLE